MPFFFLLLLPAESPVHPLHFVRKVAAFLIHVCINLNVAVQPASSTRMCCVEKHLLHCDYTTSLELLVSESGLSSWNTSVVVAKAPSFSIEEFASSNCAATEFVDRLCEIHIQQAHSRSTPIYLIQVSIGSIDTGAIQASAGIGLVTVQKINAPKLTKDPITPNSTV
jgi:hypothetical protein